VSSSDRNQHLENGKPAGTAAPTAPRGLTHRALGGMLWTFSGSGVQLLVQLGTIMALGRLLTPTEFGLMGAAAVVVALSQIVSQIGVGPAIIQRRELRPTHIRVAITLSCTLGILLGAVVWFGAPALAKFYRMPEVEPVLRAVAFLFPLDGLNTVGKSLLTRELRFRLFVGLELAAYTVGYALVGILLAWLGYGVWALVIANLSQVGLRAIAMYFAVRHPLRPSLDRQAAKDLLGFGFGHSMAQIGAALSQQGDNLVVGRWLGPEALGIYGRAYSLMVMPATAFGKIVNRVLFPVMSQVQDERKRLANAYERASAIVALISLPLSAFLWVLAPEFIAVMLGPSWTAVVLPFRLFTISLLFRTSSRISDVCTKAAGEVYWRALIQWAYAGMVVTAAIVGQRWGVGSVAVGVSIAMAINWLNMAQLSRKVTGLPWSRLARAHGPPVVLGLLVGIAAVPPAQLARAAHLGSLPTLMLAAVVVGIIAVMASMLRPELFLGQHGAWAKQRGEEILLRRSIPLTATRAEAEKFASAERLASVVEGDPK
jgi:O-antigen/teichoic acid export membrane protein